MKPLLFITNYFIINFFKLTFMYDLLMCTSIFSGIIFAIMFGSSLLGFGDTKSES